jgi:tRNA pseudouridine55 synthase
MGEKDRHTPAPSGILNVNKPQGMTSHDVVNAVRKFAGTRQVGHAGTLDPLATGVLVVCVGQATRISEYLMASRKVYRAKVRFGAATSTYDSEGEITATFPTQHLTPDMLREALARFVGAIQQRVPPYSAVKQDGQPLYRRARRGEPVEPPVREVQVYRAELLEWELPVATVEVECGPGTYIRSLAHDWGQAAGCGAHLTSLMRLASGRFTLEEAVSLERLREASADGCLQRHLIPMDEGLLDMKAIIVTEEQALALRQGQPVPASAGETSQLARAYTLEGDFVAILRYNTSSGRWLPHKVFAGGDM